MNKSVTDWTVVADLQILDDARLADCMQIHHRKIMYMASVWIWWLRTYIEPKTVQEISTIIVAWREVGYGQR